MNEKLAEFAKENIPVIIGIFNRDVEILPIVKLLNSIGFKNVISFPVFYQLFSNEMGDRFWLGKHETLITNSKEIDQTFLLLKDSISQNLYTAIFEFRLSGDFSLLPPADSSPQYFSEDVPLANHVSRFVDCGAFNGDTLQILNMTKGKIESIVCFEPDQINFDKLSEYVRNN